MSAAIALDALDAGVTVLTIDRADRMNSLTLPVFRELADAACRVARNGTRALVITGAGTRSFCAGYDLGEVDELPATAVPDFLRLEDEASGAIAAIHRLPFPVIAAINGAAVGGGLALALAADVRLAVPAAKFNAGFVLLGLSVGELATSWMLTRVVGPGRAAELSFTGTPIDADEALRIGLVSRVVSPDRLLEDAVALARACAAADPEQRIGKRTMLVRQETASYLAALAAELGDRR